MVCQEEMVRMGSQDHKDNRDHLDNRDLLDLGVLESPTLGGERAPAPPLLELMMAELAGVPMPTQEEEQRSFVCLLILTISRTLNQPAHHITLLYMEQNIKLMVAHLIIF